jgi:hypothetical protein
MFVWRTCNKVKVTFSEGGAVAAITDDYDDTTLVTSSVELTAGKHYWEVDILNCDNINDVCVGATRPNLDPNGDCTCSRRRSTAINLGPSPPPGAVRSDLQAQATTPCDTWHVGLAGGGS